MSQTGHLNILNLQMAAEDQITTDRQIGTYADNLAAYQKYYLLLSEFQTIPVGMDDNPELFVKLLGEALPQVNTLRFGFNDFNFNPDGSLHPQFERFLVSAADAGFKLIPNYFSWDVQQLGAEGGLSDAEIRNALDGYVIDPVSYTHLTLPTICSV